LNSIIPYLLPFLALFLYIHTYNLINFLAYSFLLYTLIRIFSLLMSVEWLVSSCIKDIFHLTHPLLALFLVIFPRGVASFLTLAAFLPAYCTCSSHDKLTRASRVCMYILSSSLTFYCLYLKAAAWKRSLASS
jgi:hypothetical protein